ncbi:MAG: ABC transporter permease [Pseudomonadota bacterium]
MGGQLRAFVTGLLSLVATLLAASALIFLAVNLLPGDPAAVLLGQNASDAALAALRERLGLNAPLPVQYGRFLAGALTGDFGQSATYDIPVTTLIVTRAAVSVPLALMAVLLCVAVALPAAQFAAARRGRGGDAAVEFLARAGLSVPNIWLGLGLIVLFAIELRLVPAGGFPGWADPSAALAALLLPAIALAAPQAAILTRLARTAIVERADEDFVTLGQAKGLSRAAAVRHHALPAALAPILTIIGLQFGFLLAGAIIIETVFSLPGLGRLLFQAVAQRDLPVVQGVTLVLVAAVVVVNALCAALARIADPRVAR